MFDMRNIIGKRIKLARSKSKPRMTQADLAIKLQLDGWDINRVGIAKIETGLRQVTDIEILKLARSLGVSINWFFEEIE